MDKSDDGGKVILYGARYYFCFLFSLAILKSLPKVLFAIFYLTILDIYLSITLTLSLFVNTTQPFLIIYSRKVKNSC